MAATAAAAVGREGFWEPRTSSHDFCEENYRFTLFVAELLNSASSLPIAGAGAWAWLRTPPRYRGQLRFALCWLAFVAIGLGSAAFHATLRRWAQALDEVPMVLANLVFVFCLSRPSETVAPKLAASLSAAGAAMVVVYVVFEAYAVFLSIYGLVVVYLCAVSGRDAFKRPPAVASNAAALRHLWRVAFSMYGAGFAMWVADHAACALLEVGHLHIAWHALACGGTLVFVLLLVALTADSEGSVVEVLWAKCFGLPILPYLTLPNDEAASGEPRPKRA